MQKKFCVSAEPCDLKKSVCIQTPSFNKIYMAIFPINQAIYRKFPYNFYDMEISMLVGENLKAARKAKGLTQTQIAEELKKRQTNYSGYETGKVQLDYEKIVYLCKRLDITPNDLFGIE